MPAPLPRRDDPLDEADDEAAQLAEERAPAAEARPRVAGHYRIADPVLMAERAEHERDLALANRQIEEAIENSRAQATSARRGRLLLRAAILASLLLADGALVWWWLGSVELTALSFAVVGLGFFLLESIDRIKSASGGSGPEPPVIPPGM